MTVNLALVKVGLLYDHPMVREGLENVVKGTPGMELVVSGASSPEIFSYLEKEKLDILLLDVSLGEENGLHLIEDFLNVQPDLKVVILSVSDNESYVVNAFTSGACGYLLKECDRAQISSALTSAADGITVVAPRKLLSRVLDGWAHKAGGVGSSSPSPSLNERELEILKMVAAGHSNKAIADQLFLAESTIKKYCHNAMAKLGTSNRGAAAIRAMRLGLIGLEPDADSEE